MENEDGAVFMGGTDFAIAADKLGFLREVGHFGRPAVAVTPREDAQAFEDLMSGAGIRFSRMHGT